MSLLYLLYLRLNSTCASLLFFLLWKWCDFSLHKAKFLIWSIFQIKQSKNEVSPCAPFNIPNTLMFLNLIWFFTLSFIGHRASYSSNCRYWKIRDILLLTVPQLLFFTAAHYQTWLSTVLLSEHSSHIIVWSHRQKALISCNNFIMMKWILLRNTSEVDVFKISYLQPVGDLVQYSLQPL